MLRRGDFVNACPLRIYILDKVRKKVSLMRNKSAVRFGRNALPGNVCSGDVGVVPYLSDAPAPPEKSFIRVLRDGGRFPEIELLEADCAPCGASIRSDFPTELHDL